MYDRTDDTIVAISSPPGVSPRGVIRLSGTDALRLAAGVFTGGEAGPLIDVAGHRRIMGRVCIAEGAFVPAEAYVFRAPASYTRQDVVEFHTSGSPPVLAMLLDQLTARGARQAAPGEFTARAYFAGALDLTEVEGVAAMIHARNDAQLRASEALLHGHLSRRSLALRDALADLLALLEAQIDFVEESIEFASRADVSASLGRIGKRLDDLLCDALAVERLEVLPRVMLVGRPNAGKSTLFNRLAGLDRAIQSAVAGTTRDVISVRLEVPGGEVELLDSAGISVETGETPMGREDPNALAVAATQRSMNTADLILIVVDVTDKAGATERALRALLPARPALAVFNKIDALLAGASGPAESTDGVRVSAITGEGISALGEQIGQILFARAEGHGAELVALSTGQRAALVEAREAVGRSAEICENSPEMGDSLELLALEVRSAMHALSLVGGEIATEELLGRIFARFCIGK